MAKTSKEWIRAHINDPFVKKAQKDGYASRAAYKLLAIQEKDHLMKSGDCVLDLGAAPGGWSQVAHRCVGDAGLVIGVDLLPMDVPRGVIFIQGDMREELIQTQVLDLIRERRGESGVDLVICDMAPNLSGTVAVDQPRSMLLLELALEVAETVLKPGGGFLAKCFQGEGVAEFGQELRKKFKNVKWRKPEASRSQSREIYIVGTGWKGEERG